MKRKPYYSRVLADQLVWLANYINKVGGQATALGLNATATVADAKWMQYVLGAWLVSVRTYAASGTEYCYNAGYALTGGSTFPVPPPVVPTPPAGVVPVAAGALNRIFKFVQNIKAAPLYNDGIGVDLKIIGSEITDEPISPRAKLSIAQTGNLQRVKIMFTKGTHQGVYIETRRAGQEAWEFLTINTEKPVYDERPLLVANQPEIREYRLCYWDKGDPNGAWSDPVSITVSP